MKTIIKKIVAAFLALVIFFISLLGVQRLLVPKYVTNIPEGSMISEFYDEKMNHDVIFIGDCEVYENINPIVMWEEYGVSSYVRGTSQQLMWQSYYVLEETLKYEKPSVVVLNVLSMRFDKPNSEEYNRLTFDNMRLSKTKLDALKVSMTEKENLVDYIFPILRYHYRWSELTKEDFQYYFNTEDVTHNGYMLRVDVKPAKDVPKGRPLADYTFGQMAYEYLDKITALCKENDIELVLVKAPTIYPYWYDEWNEQMEEYAAKNDISFYNFIPLADEMGIDYDTDTSDGGIHLNVYGAEKYTKYLGEILVREYGLKNNYGDPPYMKIWDEKLEAYYNDLNTKLVH
ncbi:MAG: SGNH/GDSL hydrolase family protein [Lachnospira sp.]